MTSLCVILDILLINMSMHESLTQGLCTSGSFWLYTILHYFMIATYEYVCACEWLCLCLVRQVYFQASRRDLLSILNLQLRPRLQRVDRTFHFYHPEKTFLKRQFELQQNILAQGLESKRMVQCGKPMYSHSQTRPYVRMRLRALKHLASAGIKDRFDVMRQKWS